MDDMFSIRVNVADRYYPLMIQRADEERIRKAARLINERITLYKSKYTDKEVRDYLAMVSLQFVIKMLELEDHLETDQRNAQLEEIGETLKGILTKVDKDVLSY
ncbi:MAG: cell division protein ZapA [Bacteroidales bacterium]